MKTRIRSKKLLVMAIVLAGLVVTWAMWGVRPAKAIVIIGGKTGMFTLTQGKGLRVHLVNTSGQVAIIDDGDVVDSANNILMAFSTRRLPPGQATSYEFIPNVADGQRLVMRVELLLEGDVKEGGVIPTFEVFDTATGETNILFGLDFIIDDGK